MWRNEMKDLIYKWVERFSVHGSGLKRPNWMLAKGNHSGGGCPTIAFRCDRLQTPSTALERPKYP